VSLEICSLFLRNEILTKSDVADDV
jgi:hypothetical protein